MTWGYVAVSLGIPVLFAAVLLWFSRSSRWFSTIALVVWPITEIARMWSFAAFTWAPQSLFGLHFSAASIGYALAEHEYLLQLAHPLGIDALNLLVATIAVGSITLLSVLRQREQRAALAPPVVVALLVFTSPLVATSSSPSATGRSLRFAIISERIQDVRDFSHHPLVSQTIAEAAAAQPPVDVVLLPEEFSLTSIFWSKEESSRFLKHHFGERDVLILNTRNDLFPEDERNESRESKKLVYDSTTQGELGRYVKQMLMPLGEYAPAFTKTFFSLIPDPELHLYVDDVAVIPSADRSTNTAVFRGVTIGGLLCSDILSPHLYRTLARDHGAQILVNLSNHFWFHGSRTLFWKTLQMAKVHAVRNRAPLLLSNNMAPSFALDSHGRLLAESEWGERRVLVVDISID
jgi:apolipoprotein N-acyltransferase